MKKEDILSAYGEYFLEHQESPKSMYHFAKHLEVEEERIYAHFSSFDAIQAEIIAAFVENAIELTQKQAESDESFSDQRTQLLTFYLTLTEILKGNRSLALLLLPQDKNQLQAWKNLKATKKVFLHFIRGLDIKIDALSFIPSDDIKSKTVDMAAWAQFISIMGFWIKDDSPGFERTDIFIEKSLKLSFELSDSNILQSAVD
jgi:AcrR family transcriptional regulator